MEPRPRLHVLAGRKPRCAGARWGSGHAGLIAALAIAGALPASPARARVLLREDEALRLAFPDAPPERRVALLSPEQLRTAEREARVRVESSTWTYYVGKSSSGELAYAYIDSHVVRSMPESFLAVVDEAGVLRFVELLAFHEPDDYLPPSRWLRQFDGRALDERLLLNRAVRNVAGASLTSRALTDGVRRVLAVHHVLFGGKR